MSEDHVVMTMSQNPAERLERICLGIKSWAAPAGIYDCFTSLLAATSDADLLRKMGGLHVLVVEAEARTKELTTDQFYLTWCDPVKTTIASTRNLDLTAGHLQPHLEGGHVIPSLSAAARLPQGYTNGAMPTGFAELRQRAEELRAEVDLNEQLPPDLKRFMLRQIDRILLALSEFVVMGGVAVEDAREAVTGAVCLAIGSFPDSAWTESGKSYMRRVLDAVNDLGAFASVPVTLLALPPAVQQAVDLFAG